MIIPDLFMWESPPPPPETYNAKGHKASWDSLHYIVYYMAIQSQYGLVVNALRMNANIHIKRQTSTPHCALYSSTRQRTVGTPPALPARTPGLKPGPPTRRSSEPGLGLVQARAIPHTLSTCHE